MNIIDTNLSFGSMTNRTKTEKIYLHHAAASSCSAEQIHKWHLAKGWSGAGYHFLVRKDGKVYRLRPENKVGAHTYGANTDSLGICAEGDFTKESMSEAQMNSMVELVKYLKTKYPTVNSLKKHSDANATACPGTNFPFNKIVSLANSTTITEGKKVTGKIADIQRTLNKRYGLNIGVDNIYGPETKGALVFGLQRELNVQFNKKIDEDKIFGPKTKAACEEIAKGAKGNITYIIQASLICNGYNIDADGIFGDKTLTAVKAFQKKKRN